MNLQFCVLYRHFLFRMVDLELLAPQGDMSRLLGQFAALLVLLSIAFCIRLMAIDNRLPQQVLIARAWSAEHALIAVTMLVVGLFAVLSWESTFPSRRDVRVLGPLPVRARTLFLAMIAASATALGLTVAALNGLTSLALTLALMPQVSSLLELVFSPATVWLFVTYWMTVVAAGAFIFCSVLAVQGVAAQLLPRGAFLRVSGFLQLAAFCLFVTVYFLEPSVATPKALSAVENDRALAWLPSYWFFGLFQELNGSAHEATARLARRAWTGLATVGIGTLVAYLLSCFRTLRKIEEEPDIVAASGGWHGLPRFGDSLQTAVVHFSLRTLLRSRQHRVMLAFYLGMGFAIVILFMRTPRALQVLHDANAPLLFSSLVMMCAAVVGTRVVFGVPLDVRANWVFRVTAVRSAIEYMAAIRRPLFVLSLAPVWLISASFFLSMWPWRAAVGHLVVLGLWGVILAWLCLHGFHKIPFTCSWLPGRSPVHMAFLGALGLLMTLGHAVAFELQALADPATYAKLVVVLGLATVAARWRTVTDTGPVEFEDEPAPEIQELGLLRDGAWPIEPINRGSGL